MTNEMTTSQRDYIKSLISQRQVPANIQERVDVMLSGDEVVTKARASSAIDFLLNLPKSPYITPRAEKPADLTPGVYEVAGTVYIVRPTRADKTRLYAMRLVELNSGPRTTESDEKIKIDFEYDKGAIYKIQPEHRMSFERAKELTVLYSRCIVCSKALKVGKSVEQGIGPVCIKSFPDAKVATAITGRKKVVRKVYETEFSEVA